MMSRETGRGIELEQSVRQSIADILFTPIGSRVMRREYGSLIFQLLDQPFNDATRLQVMAATATAIVTWEERMVLTAVSFVEVENGRFALQIDGKIGGMNRSSSLVYPLQLGSSL